MTEKKPAAKTTRKRTTKAANPLAGVRKVVDDRGATVYIAVVDRADTRRVAAALLEAAAEVAGEGVASVRTSTSPRGWIVPKTVARKAGFVK